MTLVPQRVMIFLFAIMLLLIVVGVVTYLFSPYVEHPRLVELIYFFHLDGENNVPTYYSILLLGLCSLLLLLITSHSYSTGDREAPYWLLLCCGFLFMGFDEAFSLHERLMKPMRAWLGDGELGIFYFSWVIPGMVLVSILALVFLGFLQRLDAMHRNRFLLAGATYLSGCIGVELISGSYVEANGVDLAYQGLVVAEEGLEMVGLIAFVGALLGYLGEQLPNGIQFAQSNPC